jgi:ABC-type bacteriocin/lantibiotic exporter with double-glycine peptidase domain
MGDVHNNIFAVEKVQKMLELEEEHKPIKEVEVLESWLSKGKINFQDVVMAYLPGKPSMLKGISFSI